MLELDQSLRVAAEVKEGGREGGGGSVRPGDHEDVCLAPEFLCGEALTRLWVLGPEEVVKEVLLCCMVELHAIIGTSAGVLNKPPAVTGDGGEEEAAETHETDWEVVSTL